MRDSLGSTLVEVLDQFHFPEQLLGFYAFPAAIFSVAPVAIRRVGPTRGHSDFCFVEVAAFLEPGVGSIT
jgi:hypothetical protein